MKQHKCPMAQMVCPRNSDPDRGKWCPCWLEYNEHNVQTGEDRITKECVFQAWPKFAIETLKAANRPTAAMESTRNEIARGFDELNGRMQRIPTLLLESRHDRNGDSETN